MDLSAAKFAFGLMSVIQSKFQNEILRVCNSTVGQNFHFSIFEWPLALSMILLLSSMFCMLLHCDKQTTYRGQSSLVKAALKLLAKSPIVSLVY